MKKWLCLMLMLTLIASCTSAMAWGKSNSDLYEDAIGLLKENKYTEAGQAFAALGSYSDSPRYTMYCSAIVAGETGFYSTAVENLQSLDGFLDSKLLATYYTGLSWETAENYEKAADVLSAITLYKDVSARIASYPEKINARDYKKADAHEQAGRLESALSGFKALGNYKDSAARAEAVQEKINARDYAAADQAEQNGQLEKALAGFKALGSYKDSQERAAAVQVKIDERAAAAAEKVKADAYAAADLAEQNGKLEEALAGFKALGSYKDSQERAAAVQVKIDERAAAAAEKVKADAYAAADLAEQNGKLEEALAGFEALGSYKDSQERAAAVQVKIDERDAAAAEQAKADAYAAADLAEQNEDYSTAYKGFTALGDYRDSAARAAVVQNKDNYAKAMQYAMRGNYSQAYKLFAALGDYEDSNEKAYVTAVSSFASKIIDLGNGTASFQFHGVWGIIDVSTNTTASPTWDEIGKFNQFDLARVKKNNQYGYINRQGQVVIPCKFYDVSAFDKNGLCTVVTQKQETSGSGYSQKTYNYYSFGLYDSTGKVITEPKWRTLGSSNNSNWGNYKNNARTEIPNFSDGKIRVMNSSGLWGFIDLAGKAVGEVRWSAINNFSEGMAAVSENGNYGYIDPNGRVVIQPQYSGARIFSDGLAWVKTSSGLWQCIDKDNNIIIPAKYSQVTEFKNGLADVELPDVGWQIIDATGKLVYFKTN